MAKALCTRLSLISRGKTRKLWITEADTDGVFMGLQQRFGKKLHEIRPTKAYMAGMKAVSKTASVQAAPVTA